PDLLGRELPGIEQAEGMRVTEPGHRHDQRLALLEGGAPGVRLRRVRVDLDDLRSLPEAMSGELLGRELGAGEIRDPALRPREAGDALPVHRLPNVPADLVLRPHQAAIMVDDIASRILRAARLLYLAAGGAGAARNGSCETCPDPEPTGTKRRIRSQGKADPRRRYARKTENAPEGPDRPGGLGRHGPAPRRRCLGIRRRPEGPDRSWRQDRRCGRRGTKRRL